jgi:predicted small secreted protein
MMACELLTRCPETSPPFYGKDLPMLSQLMCCFAALATALMLTACNTMNGMGQDIEKGGQKIQEGSKVVEHRM